MKATVTQLPEEPQAFEAAFADLVAHTQAESSDLVLLPEMPFYPWVAYEAEVDPGRWAAAIDAHEEWLARLPALGAQVVVGSRPVLDNGTPHNDAFAALADGGSQFAHRKYYLPDEDGFWEATWYRPAAQPSFKALETPVAKIGLMICSDLWFTEHARGYARQGVQLLLNPRATEKASVEKWLAGGRAAAVMAGAYGLSSNRVGQGRGFDWGGSGWIVDPNGEILARTSDKKPLVTLELDLDLADQAKNTYPRDVKE